MAVMVRRDFAFLFSFRLMDFFRASVAYFVFHIFQVKLNLSLLEDICDDIDFCFKLTKEESVIILPGKN